ncbi:hypothetical protein [Streptomyces sp. CBMA156]|uniref:hypothetical protein n=1 Tax=Streptomyces sp. CBMA156 TaxID=1930280 RepID=UPI0016620EEE|nr:hypothetical protein [Streptomyces sp. CBMA156]MBD0669954.1 hypothetical protein [Streptomyces sp. CBMA156]MBD0670519.1 hypothetical protein [Streptomyces sp. CBMA156]
MGHSLPVTLTGAFLAWEALLLIPVVPGKPVDTRDFSELPRRQYNAFDVFLTTLGLAGFVVDGFLLQRMPDPELDPAPLGEGLVALVGHHLE